MLPVELQIHILHYILDDTTLTVPYRYQVCIYFNMHKRYLAKLTLIPWKIIDENTKESPLYKCKIIDFKSIASFEYLCDQTNYNEYHISNDELYNVHLFRYYMFHMRRLVLKKRIWRSENKWDTLIYVFPSENPNYVVCNTYYKSLKIKFYQVINPEKYKLTIQGV